MSKRKRTFPHPTLLHACANMPHSHTCTLTRLTPAHTRTHKGAHIHTHAYTKTHTHIGKRIAKWWEHWRSNPDALVRDLFSARLPSVDLGVGAGHVTLSEFGEGKGEREMGSTFPHEKARYEKSESSNTSLPKQPKTWLEDNRYFFFTPFIHIHTHKRIQDTKGKMVIRVGELMSEWKIEEKMKRKPQSPSSNRGNL